jgi:hypothetical protein
MTPLQTEIALPAYAGMSDAEIAATLNAPTSATAPIAMAAKADVLILAQEVTFGAALCPTPATQQKWFALLPILCTLLTASADTVAQASVGTSIGAALADGLITSAEANAPWVKQNATRYQVIMGEGTLSVTEQQIGEARNG